MALLLFSEFFKFNNQRQWKIIYKSEKKVITETIEKFVKQGVEKETAEKLAKEEVEKSVKAAIEKRYDELAKEGHAPARHGEHLTEQPLDDRAMRGFDPVTGTTDDAFRKNPDGTPKIHKPTRNATKFTSEKALVEAENYVRKSKKYEDAVRDADATGNDYIVIKDLKLEDVLGADYKNQVFGKTRLGSSTNPTGSVATDFTDGTVNAKFYKDSSGKWKLDTMYPEPK